VLSDATLRAWRVGWSPEDRREPPERWGFRRGERPVWLPRGIVLPWFAGDELWELRVRRRGPDPATDDVPKDERYRKVRGGRALLFGADRLAGRRVGVLTEGEFDCLLLWQEAGDLVGVATLGSAAHGLDDRAAYYLLPLSPILVAYDPDAAGRAGAAALLRLSRRVRRVALPAGGDVTECWRAGAQLRDWVRFHLVRVVDPTAGPPAMVSAETPIGVPAETVPASPRLSLKALLAALRQAGVRLVVSEDATAPGGERLQIVEPYGGLPPELRAAVAARHRQLAAVVRGRFAAALPMLVRAHRPGADVRRQPPMTPAGCCQFCPAAPGTPAVRTWRDGAGYVYRLCDRHFAPLARALTRPAAE
jgi:hypothetical protein